MEKANIATFWVTAVILRDLIYRTSLIGVDLKYQATEMEGLWLKKIHFHVRELFQVSVLKEGAN